MAKPHRVCNLCSRVQSFHWFLSPRKKIENETKQLLWHHLQVPSRELTYPTWAKGSSSSKVPNGKGYVSSRYLQSHGISTSQELRTPCAWWCSVWRAMVGSEARSDLKVEIEGVPRFLDEKGVTFEIWKLKMEVVDEWFIVQCSQFLRKHIIWVELMDKTTSRCMWPESVIYWLLIDLLEKYVYINV